MVVQLGALTFGPGGLRSRHPKSAGITTRDETKRVVGTSKTWWANGAASP
jgi:hypothetical protein